MHKDIRIVVAQRGFVFVGEWSQDGDQVVLRNAKNIRRWGTSRGLGEIAQGGPTSNTVLDEAGTVRVHVLAVVASFDCAGEKWERALS